MRRFARIWGGMLVLALLLATLLSTMLSAVPPRTSESIKGSLRTSRVPVLVEVFTADSCGTCIQTDHLIEQLEKEQSIAGAEIIPIEMQMDAWGPQGFRDPYALRQITNRQNDYIRLFHLETGQTPQVVIGGQRQLVTPSELQTRDEIASVAKSPSANVEVSFRSASLASVKVERLPLSAKESEIWMAVTEANVDSPAVDATGRNAKRNHVVRSLVLLGHVTADETATFSMHLRFNPRWKREDLRYVVFVQERFSRRIWGATVVTP